MKRFALSLIGLALLAGCGIKGGLERPDPMWNREEAIAREREQTERDQQNAARRATHTTPTTVGDPNALPQPH